MAVLVHGAVLGLLLYQWPEDEAPPAAAIEHFYIDAALVNANPHKVKQRQADAARQQRTKRVKARARRDAKARQVRLEADKAALDVFQTTLSWTTTSKPQTINITRN